jgi:hypothetical protein
MAGAATGGQTATPNANLPSGMTGPQFSVSMNDMSNTGMVQPGTRTITTPDGSTITPQGMMPQNPDIMQGAARGIFGAGATTAAGMGFDPGTLAQTNIAQYQNPYTEQVIRANEADILRGAQKGINALDFSAGRAGAFGGSRHGVALGELGTGVAQQLAQSSAGLRQAGFQQAQQMAQQDIQNRLQAQQGRLGAAGQLANIAQTGFGMGQDVLSNMQNVGSQQTGIQQALIDAAKGQYSGYTGFPAQALGFMGQALGATPYGSTTTASRQPGLFDYLTMGAMAFGGR